MRPGPGRIWVAAFVLTGLATACSTTGSVATQLTPAPSRSPRPSVTVSGDPYATTVSAAHGRGLVVWIDTDLAKRWRQGPRAYQAALTRVVDLARRPGVVGVKVADELAYNDGFDRDPKGVRAFLADAAKRLHTEVPGTKVMLDLVVPDLGCAPGVPRLAVQTRACQAAADDSHPALALPVLDRLLADRSIDVLNLSTGLLSGAEYSTWQFTREDAQRAAWSEVRRRGWPKLVTLNARKALAHPGSYTGTPATAQDDVNLFVDLPRSLGAQAVDVWAWRQSYKGQVRRVLNPGLQTNALWRALEQRHAAGVPLLTNLTPSSLEVSLDADLDELATVFTGVLVAAGTG
jgi:hypothetical protein